jgi:hypothetical protein
MHQLQRSRVRSQHPSAQWNLRGGRWSSAEYCTKEKKIPPKNIEKKKFMYAKNTRSVLWHSPFKTRGEWRASIMSVRWLIGWWGGEERQELIIQRTWDWLIGNKVRRPARTPNQTRPNQTKPTNSNKMKPDDNINRWMPILGQLTKTLPYVKTKKFQTIGNTIRRASLNNAKTY